MPKTKGKKSFDAKPSSSSPAPTKPTVSKLFASLTFACSTIDPVQVFGNGLRTMKKAKICYKCGSEDHRLDACPEEGSELPYAECFLCKTKGHMSGVCPNPPFAASTTKSPPPAVSTDPASAASYNYATLLDLLRSHSAKIIETITAKKTHSLITTASARLSLTQKVRKASKRGLLILDVSWIETCISANKLLPTDDYDKDDEIALACSALEASKAAANANVDHNVKVEFVSNNVEGGGEGWSEPMHFGCSCVCHENLGDHVITECEWCTDCSHNVALRAKRK